MLAQKNINLSSLLSKDKIFKQQQINDKRCNQFFDTVQFGKRFDILEQKIASKSHLKEAKMPYEAKLQYTAKAKPQILLKEKVQSLIQQKLKITAKESNNIDKFIVKSNKHNSGGNGLLISTKKNGQTKFQEYFSEPALNKKRNLGLLCEKENKVQAMNKMSTNQANFKKVKSNPMTFLLN